jgi:isopentenyl-diphosphate delta-isomerase
MDTPENRKKDHIELAFRSQTNPSELDERFHYEPMLSAHPQGGLKPITILGKALRAPMWVSSLTGGTKLAGKINRNLARACNEFGLGMGLGSCRIIMENDTCFGDFDMRDLIGEHLPLWANLGIAQVEELVARRQVEKASELVKKLRADGLIIHVNPMQEWLQPDGDILSKAPLETIQRFLDLFPHPVIVKEVGQGMGPESLRELLQLPVQAIEFAAFGGANFSRIELMRNGGVPEAHHEPLTRVGEDAFNMLGYVNGIVASHPVECREIIISGGIKTYLDGYYLLKKSSLPALFGMASTFLKYARGDYQELRKFIDSQVKGLEMAYAYLTIKEPNGNGVSHGT